MSSQPTKARWEQAQKAEQTYWDNVDGTELLRICAEKPAFLYQFDYDEWSSLFDDKEVLEVGCGPLGLSLASFYYNKKQISRLLKTDPLPHIPLSQTKAAKEPWCRGFYEWVEQLAAEGEYKQTPGESITESEQFDTVICYNALDHVHSPESILQNCFQALKPGGLILVGVDCYSLFGHWRFEYYLRRKLKGSVVVEAHPHTFLYQDVIRLMQEAGFNNVKPGGIPSKVNQYIGGSYRASFVANRP